MKNNTSIRVIEAIKESISVKETILSDSQLLNTIEKVTEVIIETYKNGGKVIFAGNGGSAADAQHLAAELTGRFYKDRPPLNALALHSNTSFITAVANDYSYDEIYSRAIKAHATKNDVFIAISTSGNSTNLINAIQACKELSVTTVAFTGETGGLMKSTCDFLINVPSKDTPRIQEAHILIGHIICELIEKALF